jgi:hypothetical protein
MMNYVSLVSLPQFVLHHGHGHGPNLGIFNLKLSVSPYHRRRNVPVLMRPGLGLGGTGAGQVDHILSKFLTIIVC